MEDKQILEAILHEIKDMKADMNDIKADMNDMKADMNDMKADMHELKERTTKIEVTLENDVNRNIQLLMEGHIGLVQNIKEIKQDTSQIEDIKNRLFAAETVTKENVQNIKKLQTKRKI